MTQEQVVAIAQQIISGMPCAKTK